ncbi:MAG: hypothetical protein ACJAVV_003151 [Alphaproteobacteria bacterium]|jgi:hypothetical protein
MACKKSNKSEVVKKPDTEIRDEITEIRGEITK